jgi:hypothetical protein
VALNEAIRVHLLMNQYATRRMKTFMQRALKELVKQTPRRTGWAESNWLVGVGRQVPRKPVGSKQRVDYGPQKQSLRIIRSWKPEQGVLVLVNNVPYIGLLNQGRSSQAPAGFVDEVLAKLARELGG